MTACVKGQGCAAQQIMCMITLHSQQSNLYPHICFPSSCFECGCRFFMFLALLFLTHQIGIGIYRVVATAARQIVVANAGGMLLLLCVFLMNGFVIRREYIHPWVIWYALLPAACKLLALKRPTQCAQYASTNQHWSQCRLTPCHPISLAERLSEKQSDSATYRACVLSCDDMQ